MNPERSSLTPEEITIVEGTAKGNSNAEHAIIERKKVAHYPVNSAHPDNGGKAPFFVGYFTRRGDSATGCFSGVGP